MTPSRSIPWKIKRVVRQRCGFGCVICGLPIYQYDHVLGYTNVKRHVASEITLLCPTHHDEKTKELITLDALTRANNNPFNHQQGKSTGYILRYEGDSPEMLLGGQRFYCIGRPTLMIPVMVHGTPFFGFRIGAKSLDLNLIAFNSKNELILKIENNEVVYFSTVWDVTLIGRRLTIREAAREFIVDLEFNLPNQVIVHAYRFQRDGYTVDIDRQKFSYKNPSGVSLNVTGNGNIIANIGLLIGDYKFAGQLSVGMHHPDN